MGRRGAVRRWIGRELPAPSVDGVERNTQAHSHQADVVGKGTSIAATRLCERTVDHTKHVVKTNYRLTNFRLFVNQLPTYPPT